MIDVSLSPLGAARRRLARNKVAMASLAFLCVMTLACIIGPWLVPHQHDQVFRDYVRAAPSIMAHPFTDETAPALARVAQRLDATTSELKISNGHALVMLTASAPIDPRGLALFARSGFFEAPRVIESRADGHQLKLDLPLRQNTFLFGTDANGRDLLARLLMAGRISLAVGLFASLVALIIGTFWGAVAGYVGGRVDAVMMRIVDVIYALPFIFFVIVLVVVFGRNFLLVFAAIGAVEWLDMARIVRGQTLSIKRQDYVGAAEALGVTTPAIIWRHILPNAMGPVFAYLALLVPRVILTESFISFLGLGVQEPLTSWGVLIADGARNIQSAVHLLIFPALFLGLTLIAFNVLGEGLRDALDPRSEP